MSRPPHGRAAPRDSALQALNAANEDAQLDDLLHQYFRLALPPSGVTKRRLKRPRLAAGAPDVVEQQTTTPEAARKRIKTFLKASTNDKHMQRVLDALTNQLHKAKKHAPVLPLAVQLATELFARSAAFRTLIATQAASFYTKLLEAAGEKNVATQRRRNAGPTTQSTAVHMVLAVIETWREDFGGRYPTIVAGHAWLLERGYSFPRTKETIANVAREQAERVRRQTSVRRLQVQKMEREMATRVPEMETTMVEMDSIFEILVPTLEAFELEEKEDGGDAKDQAVGQTTRLVSTDGEVDEEDDAVEWENISNRPGDRGTTQSNDDEIASVASKGQEEGEEDDIEWEDVADDDDDEDGDSHAEDEDDRNAIAAEDMDINDIVQAYGLGSSSYQLTISIPTTLCEQSAENEVLFQTLADGVLQIRKRFLPLVHDWLQIADSDAVVLDQPRDSALLRKLHALRQRLDNVTLKWEDLVKENERKQFARIRPRIVTMPLAAFDGPLSSSSRGRPLPQRRARQTLL